MGRIHSFLPVLGANPQLLILGSMPSVISLKQQAYYANSQNAFWKIMGRLLEFDAAAPYNKRIASLKKGRVALWDVCQSCKRVGSLDSAIKEEKPNNIAELVALHSIGAIFLNGGKAAISFFRHIDLTALQPDIAIYKLPSTSPANARMNFETKYKKWEEAWQKTF